MPQASSFTNNIRAYSEGRNNKVQYPGGIDQLNELGALSCSPVSWNTVRYSKNKTCIPECPTPQIDYSAVMILEGNTLKVVINPPSSAIITYYKLYNDVWSVVETHKFAYHIDYLIVSRGFYYKAVVDFADGSILELDSILYPSEITYLSLYRVDTELYISISSNPSSPSNIRRVDYYENGLLLTVGNQPKLGPVPYTFGKSYYAKIITWADETIQTNTYSQSFPTVTSAVLAKGDGDMLLTVELDVPSDIHIDYKRSDSSLGPYSTFHSADIQNNSSTSIGDNPTVDIAKYYIATITPTTGLEYTTPYFNYCASVLSGSFAKNEGHVNLTIGLDIQSNLNISYQKYDSNKQRVDYSISHDLTAAGTTVTDFITPEAGFYYNAIITPTNGIAFTTDYFNFHSIINSTTRPITFVKANGIPTLSVTLDHPSEVSILYKQSQSLNGIYFTYGSLITKPIDNQAFIRDYPNLAIENYYKAIVTPKLGDSVTSDPFKYCAAVTNAHIDKVFDANISSIVLTVVLDISSTISIIYKRSTTQNGTYANWTGNNNNININQEVASATYNPNFDEEYYYKAFITPKNGLEYITQVFKYTGTVLNATLSKYGTIAQLNGTLDISCNIKIDYTRSSNPNNTYTNWAGNNNNIAQYYQNDLVFTYNTQNPFDVGYYYKATITPKNGDPFSTDPLQYIGVVTGASFIFVNGSLTLTIDIDVITPAIISYKRHLPDQQYPSEPFLTQNWSSIYPGIQIPLGSFPSGYFYKAEITPSGGDLYSVEIDYTGNIGTANIDIGGTSPSLTVSLNIPITFDIQYRRSSDGITSWDSFGALIPKVTDGISTTVTDSSIDFAAGYFYKAIISAVGATSIESNIVEYVPSVTIASITLYDLEGTQTYSLVLSISLNFPREVTVTYQRSTVLEGPYSNWNYNTKTIAATTSNFIEQMDIFDINYYYIAYITPTDGDTYNTDPFLYTSTVLPSVVTSSFFEVVNTILKLSVELDIVPSDITIRYTESLTYAGTYTPIGTSTIVNQTIAFTRHTVPVNLFTSGRYYKAEITPANGTAVYLTDPYRFI